MRTLNSGLGRPWRRHGLLPRKLSLKGMGGIPLQGGVARSASAGVGRLSAGQVTLHLASTVFGWGTLATSPSDLGIATPLGPSNARPQFLPLAALATRSPHEKAPLKTTGSGTLRSCLLCLGRPLLCRPVGLAHGLDHAVAVPQPPRTSESRPTPLGPFKRAPPIPAPGPLGDTIPSSREGPPSRPRVAALFGAACSASVNRSCEGQLALHMALTVRLQRLSRLALGLGITPHMSGLSRQIGRIASVATQNRSLIEARPRGPPQCSDACNSPHARQTSRRSTDPPPQCGDACSVLTPRTASDQEVRQLQGPPPQHSNASIHLARPKQSGVPPTVRTPP
jgi:hypothetical protein